MAVAKSYEQLLRENSDMQARLAEAEETLRAIRGGEVDALVVSTPIGNQIFTLQSADHPYRLMVEQMQQGAVTVSINGTILYCNRYFAAILGHPSDLLVSHQIDQYIVSSEREAFQTFLQTASSEGGIYREFNCQDQINQVVPIYIAANVLLLDQRRVICLVVTDLRERKQAEGELARLAAIVTSSNDAIISKTRDGIITSWNQGAARIFGYTADEIIQKPVKILIPPEKMDEEASILQKLTAGETVLNYDTIRLKKDGTPVFVAVSLSPIKDMRGNIVGISTIAHDVTERKRVEAKLAASEQRYRRLFEAAKDGILILDARTGQVLAANSFLLDLLGYSLEDLLGQELWEVGLFKDIVSSQAAFRELQDKGYIRYQDLPLETRDGRRIEVEFVSNVYRVNDESVIQCNIRDITERKRAEESHRFQAHLLNSVGQAVITSDLQGKVIYWNHFAETLYGWSAAEALGRDIAQLVVNNASSEQAAEIMARLSGGENWSGEFEVQRRDGTVFPALVNDTPVYDTTGRLIGIIGISTDISERKANDDKLRRLNRMLAVLSNVNGAIIRVRSTSVLFEQICRIAVDVGGFRMAWIGLLDAEIMEVNPVTSAGVTDGYLEKINIVVDGGIRGQGPTGSVVSTGEHVIAQNIENDPLLAPWREDALRLGYRSSAALPLKIAGKVHGVLSLYASKVSFFDDEEIKLLDEMAQDISFALDFAEQQAQRNEAEVTLHHHVQIIEEMRLFLQTTLDAFPTNTAVLSTDGTIINVNASWIDFAIQNSAPSPLHYLGENYLTVCDTAVGPMSEQAAPAADGIRAVIEGRRDEFYLEYPCDSSAEKRWFLMGVTSFPEPTPRRVVITHINITERKQAEVQLQEAHDLLEQRVIERTAELNFAKQRAEVILNSSPEGILLLSPDLRIQQVNPAFNGLFASQPDAYFNHSLFDLFQEPDAPGIRAVVQTVAAETPGQRIETRAHRKDDTVFDAELSIGHIPDGALVCTIIDITARKQAEESLRQALASEKELGELKSRFVSMASHEFRTPLATILATTDTLSAYRQRMTEAQIDEKFLKIKEQVGHLKDIMEDVLQLARMQARRVEFNPVMVDLNALCRSIVEEFQSRPDVHHQLVYSRDGSVPDARLDQKLMRQILVNLVSNAIKYSPSDKPVSIRLTATAQALVLSVADQGIGIPESDKKHLFEPFHRAGNVNTISGTGLGLVITKEAVELHGGTLTFESQVNVGTTFTVRIPVLIE